MFGCPKQRLALKQAVAREVGRLLTRGAAPISRLEA